MAGGGLPEEGHCLLLPTVLPPGRPHSHPPHPAPPLANKHSSPTKVCFTAPT